MKENNREKGGRAELMTARWIQKYKGYCVLARNYSRKTGEIDIIRKDGKTFIFIEVKFRTGTNCGYPSEAVTLTKQKRIMSTAALYMQEKGGTDARFDVAEIVEAGGKYYIRYIENAFEWRSD